MAINREKEEKALVKEASTRYNELIASILLVALSNSKKRIKLKQIKKLIAKVKVFNKEFVKQFYDIYRDHVREAYLEAKLDSKAAGEQEKQPITNSQSKEAIALRDQIEFELDQRADFYEVKARRLLNKQEIAAIREDELGLEDGEEKVVVNRTKIKKDIEFQDSKGRRITADVLMAIIVGDRYWDLTTAARRSSWVISGITKARHISVVDERTTPICRSLNGEVRDLLKDKLPPMHINCRSRLEPIIDN